MSDDDQRSFFTPPSEEVTKVTEKAIAKAERGTDPRWRMKALNALFGVCEWKSEFTTDDVWTWLEIDEVVPPREPSALGPIMRVGSSMKWAESTNMTRESTRPSQHRRPQRVWHSLIYRQGGTV